MRGRWTMWLRVAVIAMLASVATAVWSVLEGLETDPLPGIQQPPSDGEIERAGRATRTRVNIAAAVDADPFNPERQRPEEPYRFPGEIPPTQVAAAQRDRKSVV